MYWARDRVRWHANPHLYGREHPKADRIDLAGQRGVYLLYDTRGPVYVGQVTGQSLGRRLWQHTTDRLASRWHLFSWFGLCPVEEDGTLGDPRGTTSAKQLIGTMESLLIEALEPRQNRQAGAFTGIEYTQADDPAWDG